MPASATHARILSFYCWLVYRRGLHLPLLTQQSGALSRILSSIFLCPGHTQRVILLLCTGTLSRFFFLSCCRCALTAFFVEVAGAHSRRSCRLLRYTGTLSWCSSSCLVIQYTLTDPSFAFFLLLILRIDHPHQHVPSIGTKPIFRSSIVTHHVNDLSVPIHPSALTLLSSAHNRSLR